MRALLLQSQHQLVSDYERMKAMQEEERHSIAGRVTNFEPGVLTGLAIGDSAVLAAALGWTHDVVEAAKSGWFEAEFTSAQHKEASSFKLKEDMQILRGGGFASAEASRYFRDAEELVRCCMGLFGAYVCVFERTSSSCSMHPRRLRMLHARACDTRMEVWFAMVVVIGDHSGVIPGKQ